jgi:hypothetical protein
LDAIERAIRNALEKGAAEDRAFREKVYRQAFAALERALQANPSVTVETAIRRRKGLQAKITEIEEEFLPPVTETAAEREDHQPSESEGEPPADAPAVSVAVDPPAERPEATFTGHIQMRPDTPASVETIPVAPEIRVESAAGPTPAVPDIMLETKPDVRPIAEPTASGVAEIADRRTARAEKRRPFAAIFLGVTLLCLLAIGVWWAIQTGLINPPSQEITGIEGPASETEDFEPGTEGEPAKPGTPEPERTWISVFTPTDPTTVSAPGDTSADVLKEASGEFMRIRSGTSGSAIIFDVGQGILEQIAGKKATFDVVARAEEGSYTEMSVACNFSELGDCGRKRYAVGGTKADYLFEIDVPAATPGAGGTIAINSDFSNSGKAVDVYEIKVSVVP